MKKQLLLCMAFCMALMAQAQSINITFVSEPASILVCPGATATFAATAIGASSVRWQLSTDNGSTFTDIAGANTDTLTFVTIPADAGHQFRAVYTNALFQDTATTAGVIFMGQMGYDTITTSICNGQSYTVGGNTYNTAGNYTVTLSGQSASGCDSIVTLNLSVSSGGLDTINATICGGQSYVVGGASYTNPGSYTITLAGAAVSGCDSIISFNFTVSGQVATDTINATITQGQSYVAGGSSYTNQGNYTITLAGAAASGCDSIITLNLTVIAGSNAYDTISTTICNGQSYVIGGASYTNAGSYTITLTGAAVSGGDSIITLYLGVTTGGLDTINTTITQGQSYIAGGASYTNQGNYTITLPGAAVSGCDSIITLNLTVIAGSNAYDTISTTICNGQSYVIGGASYTNAGSYTITLTGAAVSGGDSIITLYLGVTTGGLDTINATITQGQSYVAGGASYTNQGNYTITLPGAAVSGCDSIITLNLTVTGGSNAYDTITTTICSNQSYVIGGASYTNAGSYTITLTGAAVSGGDSIITLNLSVTPAGYDTINATITQGQSYVAGGASYTNPGNYTITLPSAAVSGCDSVITLNLTVIAGSNAYDTIITTICNGQSYIAGGSAYTNAGTYTITLTGAAVSGGDSIITLYLGVATGGLDTINATICSGQSYAAGGSSYNMAGTYSITLTGAAVSGCDSIITLNLSVLSPANDTINASVCSGGGYTFGGNTYTTAGQYNLTLPNASVNGCDSIITLNLSIGQYATSSISASVCTGGSYTVGTTVHTGAGTYSDTLRGAAAGGCDSVVNLTLTNYPAAVGTMYVSVCSGGHYTWGTHTYSQTGNYTDTLLGASAHGCDSIVTLHLYIGSAVATIYSSLCTGQHFTVGTHNYATTGNYSDTLRGAAVHGCDSIVNLHLSVYQPVSSNITTNTCSNEGFAVGSHLYTAAGTYNDTLRGASAYGCDSFITLHLTVYDPMIDTIYAAVCQGLSYSIGTHLYSTAGTHWDTLTNTTPNGCMILVRLELEVVARINDTATVSGSHCTAHQDRATYQWINCANNQPVVGANSQTFTATRNGSYRCIEMLGTCVDTTNCVTVSGLSVSDVSAYDLTLYPNPTSGTFVISQDQAATLNVSIENMIGERVQEHTMTGTQSQFDISDLASGVYLVSVSDEKQVLHVFKVVKQ